MDKHIETALKTWYPKEHPLHMDLEPSLMGLAGECGELVDLYKKAKFKPGFKLTREMELDELGDIWYYWRIVAYQIRADIDGYDDIMTIPPMREKYYLAAQMNYQAARALAEELELGKYITNIPYQIDMLKYYLKEILTLLSIDNLNQLTELNWQKLSKREEDGVGYQNEL